MRNSCLALLMTLLSFNAWAYDESLRPGLIKAQQGNFYGAANDWSKVADDTGITNTAANLELVGFAKVLATIAHERTERTEAFNTWGESVIAFLHAGTSWDQHRLILQTKIDALSDGLGAATSEAEAATRRVSTGSEILLALEDITGFLSYEGPTEELLEEPEDDTTLNVTYNFSARPLALQEETVANRGVTTDVQTETESPLARGANPVYLETEPSDAPATSTSLTKDGDVVAITTIPEEPVNEGFGLQLSGDLISTDEITDTNDDASPPSVPVGLVVEPQLETDFYAEEIEAIENLATGTTDLQVYDPSEGTEPLYEEYYNEPDDPGLTLTLSGLGDATSENTNADYTEEEPIQESAYATLNTEAEPEVDEDEILPPVTQVDTTSDELGLDNLPDPNVLLWRNPH